VATRAVGAGEALVIDGKMGNLELLVRGWAALEANGHGPVIPLASFGNGVLEVAEVLADAARDTQGGSKSHDEAHLRVGAKWHQWRCKEELRAPRISCDLDSSAFPQALVLCIAYSIRLLELSAGPVENADWSETSKGVDVGTDSGFRELESGFDDTWKDRVLHRAYGLIAQGCESAETWYRAALVQLPIDHGGAGPQEALRHSLSDAADSLERCVRRARRQAERRKWSAGL